MLGLCRGQNPTYTCGKKREWEMSMSGDDDTRVYMVLKNHEEQYSLWLKCNEIPSGWQAVGKEGHKAECLQYIKEAWTDMRPLSLRMKMESGGLRDGTYGYVQSVINELSSAFTGVLLGSSTSVGGAGSW